jgi:glycosyltransferase involved in cell wall biosynthesis
LQPTTANDLRVQLTMPTWTIHRSTDRSYIYERFARLGERHALHFSPANSARYLTAWNARYLAQRALGAAGIVREEGVLTPPLYGRSDADVVFSYGDFPDGYAGLPVVWEHTFAPQLNSDEAEWQRQWRERAGTVVERASRVVTATEVSAEWFVRMFPGAAAKIRCVPYYFPDLVAIDDAALQAKCENQGPVRLLFVGKQARRKGLLNFVSAFNSLDPTTQRQLEVHVVSAMLDGPIALPASWHWQRSVADVQAVMRDAHVLVFPVLGEAFGLVLVEAMAAGCMPLTTSAPIQRSIVGPAAGQFVDPHDPNALAGRLRALAHDRPQLEHGMRAARERFVERYAPASVGQRYANLLWEAAGRSGSAAVRVPAESLG